MDQPLLIAKALSKSYPGVVALEDFSIHVNAGEIVGLLGPNGAGKTTALRMLAAILSPTSGSAEVCGYDTRRQPLEVKRRLGFLSGDTALYQRLTPREVLHFFGRLHSMAPLAIAQRAEKLIDQLDMTAFADRTCATLSTGQQQKANIARTLLHDPPVLILDEPTTALDIMTGRAIIDAVRNARDNGKAVLFSTHVMGEAELLCDRICLIHRGRVRIEGSMVELQRHTGRRTLDEIFLTVAGEE